jgi:hypothetical protein
MPSIKSVFTHVFAVALGALLMLVIKAPAQEKVSLAEIFKAEKELCVKAGQVTNGDRPALTCIKRKTSAGKNEACAALWNMTGSCKQVNEKHHFCKKINQRWDRLQCKPPKV